MKVNELRYDNIVMYDDDYWSINAIDGSSDEVDLYNEDHVSGLDVYALSPISITDELLEIMGFKRMPLSSVKRYYCNQTLFYIQFYKNEWYVYGYKYYPNGFKYLHELQNIFFFLTGKELEIKLKNLL